MPLGKLKQYLDDGNVRYLSISHSPAYTAQEIAAEAHIPGNQLAKTVIVKADGEMEMVVLPASYQVDFALLREALHAETVELADEAEFAARFPDCEPGAMPPFGNLFGMPVTVAPELTEDVEIAFNAGSHNELLRMSYADFARVVGPRVTRFAVHAH